MFLSARLTGAAFQVPLLPSTLWSPPEGQADCARNLLVLQSLEILFKGILKGIEHLGMSREAPEAAGEWEVVGSLWSWPPVTTTGGDYCIESMCSTIKLQYS